MATGILEAASQLANTLIKENYFGKSCFGSGYNFVTGERDVQHEATNNKLTKEIAQSYCPEGYVVTNVRYSNSDKYHLVSFYIKAA